MKPKRGIVLIIVLCVVLLLVLAGASFMFITTSEMRTVRMQNDSTKAFYLADAGIQVAFRRLFLDFKGDPTNPSWADGNIDGIDVTNGGVISMPQNWAFTTPIDDPSQPFYELLSGTLGEGTYSVALLNIGGSDNQAYLRSTGMVRGAARTIVVRARIIDLSPWNAVIFGGEGMASASGGSMVNGNVNIAGSVHLLGTNISSADYAIKMNGAARIYNNYSQLDALHPFRSKIPPCPTTIFNGEVVETLFSTLMVRNGQVGLYGSAYAGEQDVPADGDKETLDGVYITDGYGDYGTSHIYSDNGTMHKYDLGVGDVAYFPTLTGSYTDPGGTTWTSYLNYLKADTGADAYVVTAAEADILANISSEVNFSIIDPNKSGNKIEMKDGILEISGIIYIPDGGDLVFKSKGAPKKEQIIYRGKGSIIATGDVTIGTDVFSQRTFPTQDVLGIMTPNDIEFTEAQLRVMGAFYAEDNINVKFQTDIAGSLVANFVDMQTQVPSIFQVPALADNLPPGMLDTWNLWIISMWDWQEI